MLKVFLIRHGKTLGNTQGKYIGCKTDENLCSQGIEEIKKRQYPKAQFVYASPMKRCLETAALIYPSLSMDTNVLLRECDFGKFENKNYQELSEVKEYQEWIDSNGTLPFPNGEGMEEFRKRCAKGFEECILEAFSKGQKQIAIVVHGGTIMSILSHFAVPRGEYFKWQIGNGEFYELHIEKEVWKQKKEISLVQKG